MTAVQDHDAEMVRLERASAWRLRLAEGELADAERLVFETWLAEDPDNRAAFEDAVRVWRMLDEASLTAQVIPLRRAALDNFSKASRSRWKVKPRRWRIAAPIAATLVLAMGCGGLWFQGLSQDYATGIGERRVVRLSDGSRLSLDASTAVDVHYSGSRRDLRLERGRAKFDVAHDASRPFAVTAADKMIVATGTEFSVERLGDTVHVILYEGHVRVLARDGGDARRPAPLRLGAAQVAADQSLTPGRELVARLAAPTAEVVASDPGRSLSWEAGQLVFVDEPLASAVERVNRYSPQKVAVADAAAGRVLVNGVFTAGDTASFVEGATGVLPLRAIVEDGRTILASR